MLVTPPIRINGLDKENYVTDIEYVQPFPNAIVENPDTS